MDALSIHNIVLESEANGPGVRTVFWVQGCDLACVGCANPATHDARDNQSMSTRELLSRISPNAQGVTISGGEPFQQPLEPLIELISACKARGLSVVVFSGYAMDELVSISALAGNSSLLNKLANEIDLLIAGRYVQELRVHELPLLSTSNQKWHFLSDRYTEEDVINSGFGEYIFDFESNSRVKTGVM